VASTPGDLVGDPLPELAGQPSRQVVVKERIAPLALPRSKHRGPSRCVGDASNQGFRLAHGFASYSGLHTDCAQGGSDVD